MENGILEVIGSVGAECCASGSTLGRCPAWLDAPPRLEVSREAQATRSVDAIRYALVF